MLVFIRLDVAPVGVHTTRGRRRPAEEDGKIRGSERWLPPSRPSTRVESREGGGEAALHCQRGVAVCMCRRADGRTPLIKNAIAAPR